MIQTKVNSAKLKQALERFGTLEKAVAALRGEKKALIKSKSHLSQDNAHMKLAREKLSSEITTLEGKHNDLKAQLKLMIDWKEKHAHQYNLFEGFLAMLAGSPSVTNPIESLIALFQTLLNPGWDASKKADEARALFLNATMGDYLKSFYCHNCGASFITNKEPVNKYFYNYYICPACHSSGIKPDDSFLRAMASEKQLEKTLRLEQLQKENDSLQPFKIFFNVTCCICGKPVTEWSKLNLKKGITGLGWGHIACWNTPEGQAKQLVKLLKDSI